MKILTSIVLAGTFDDVNAISTLCADQSCECDTENLIKWENAMTEWKIDQKKWRLEFNNWLSEYGTTIDLDNADSSKDDNNVETQLILAEYILDIKTFILDNSIEINWTMEDYGKLFTFWGSGDLDRTNVEAVYTSIATELARNIDQNNNFSVENLFDIIINVETYISFLYQRMTAFGLDSDNLSQLSEKNRNRVLDLGAVYDFIFELFENSEFQKKMNVIFADNESFTYAWYNVNLDGEGAKEWIKQAMPINACLELINFVETFVMTTFSNFDPKLSAAFVLNLIRCISLDDLNTLLKNGADESWLAIILEDLNKSQCIARVPRNMNIFGIESSMFNK